MNRRIEMKKLIVFACVDGIECSKIEMVKRSDMECATCQAYANPASQQHRFGRKDACGIMERPAKVVKKIKTKGQGKTKAGGNR
jgi:hypothetical protein